jgi:hypothetical protein
MGSPMSAPRVPAHKTSHMRTNRGDFVNLALRIPVTGFRLTVIEIYPVFIAISTASFSLWAILAAGKAIETHEHTVSSLRVLTQGELPREIYLELFTCVHIVP